MKKFTYISLLLLSFISSCRVTESPKKLSESRIPYLQQRLKSSIWQVRYSLVNDLNGRDEETKRLLEILIQDENRQVANQALVRYLLYFVNINKHLFDPSLFTHPRGQFPLQVLPKDDFNRALVNYCLGRGDITPKDRFRIDDTSGFIKVLDVNEIESPEMYQPITIVGILGNKEDAEVLYPFLESTNDYVALGAAKALIRLGEEERGVQTLKRIINKPVDRNLYHITESLYALRELQDEDFKPLTMEVLKKVQAEKHIQSGWLNAFLLLAAEVCNDVWD